LTCGFVARINPAATGPTMPAGSPTKSFRLSLVTDGTTNSAAAGLPTVVRVTSSFAHEVWMSPVRNTTSRVLCARRWATSSSRSAL
jgi:hypothetical protein